MKGVDDSQAPKLLTSPFGSLCDSTLWFVAYSYNKKSVCFANKILWFLLLWTCAILGRSATATALLDNDLFLLYELEDGSLESSTQAANCANFIVLCKCLLFYLPKVTPQGAG